ncbi:MAG: hypothetical protein IJN50_03330 [Clostridia bacterium]|nr:hypothetical protein [Clostridia bacterium]
MKKGGNFFKRIKVKETPKPIITNNNIDDIQIQIEGDINIFPDEEKQIMQGAKSLLEMGLASNIEEAIAVFAVQFRGLSFCEKKKTDDGKAIIILRETAQRDLTSEIEKG